MIKICNTCNKEYKARLSRQMYCCRGCIPVWNKGKKEPVSVTHKRSLAMKKWWANPENRNIQSQSHKGRPKEEHPMWGRKRPDITGKKHPNWKGGISIKNNGDRASSDYSIWRRNVLSRDNYTCQVCDQYGGYLHADHIRSFAEFPELRYELNNGRALCQSCHYYVTFKRKMPINLVWGISYNRKRG